MNKMNKFDKLFNLIMEEIVEGETSNKLTPKTVLPVDQCNPQHCYKWVKGKVNVYGCKITEDNLDAVKSFLKVREKSDLTPTVGKFVVYNPQIKEKDGQIWMNKLNGYTQGKKRLTTKNGLKFQEYIFTPKEKEEDMVEGEDYWYGFQIPKGMTFNIESGCGNNGADGSEAKSTDWLPIVNEKFDWARSRGSMEQSNFTCVSDASENKLDEKCLTSWKEQFEAFSNLDSADKEESDSANDEDTE